MSDPDLVDSHGVAAKCCTADAPNSNNEPERIIHPAFDDFSGYEITRVRRNGGISVKFWPRTWHMVVCRFESLQASLPDPITKLRLDISV
jgi:hypothetical protein